MQIAESMLDSKIQDPRFHIVRDVAPNKVRAHHLKSYNEPYGNFASGTTMNHGQPLALCSLARMNCISKLNMAKA